MNNNNSRSNPGEKSGGDDSDHRQFDLANSGHDNDADNSKKDSSQSDIDDRGTFTSDDKTSSRASSQQDVSEDRKSDGFNVSKQTHRRSASLQKVEPSKAKSFSTQLYSMLNSETDAGSQAVQWLQDGRGFVIRNQKLFEQLLPKYFDTCIFQSFLRRLYRWGFKQTDKSTAGSGHYVFIHEVFRKDSYIHQNMKPLPRNKKAPPEVKKDCTSHDETITLDIQNPAGLQNQSDGIACIEASYRLAIGAHGISAGFTASPSPLELPPQLASAQNELVQLVNTIVSTYSSSPVLLSSLQSDLANLLHGIPPTQLNSIQQQISASSTDTSQTVPTASQEPIVSIVDGIIRFLTHRQSGFPEVPGQVMNCIATTNAMQQQSATPPLLSSAFQGYDNHTPHSFLPGNPLHFFRGNNRAPNLATNTDTTTATSSTNSTEDTNGGDTAASDTSFSTTRASSPGDNLAPLRNNRKRERATSPDN